jgi:four helix bundle protein
MTTMATAQQIRSHRDLIVWQRGMDLVDAVYRVSRRFPADEAFGLRSQLRRAAVSIPANIAEGQARFTPRDFAHFLVNARSSAMELETLLTVATRQDYVSHKLADQIFSEIIELNKMLLSLRIKILRSQTKR